MEFLLLVAIGLLVVLLVRSVSRSSTSVDKQDVESLRSEMRDNLSQIRGMVETQITNFRNEVSTNLIGVRQEVGSRLDNTANIIGQVQKNLGELTETTKQIQEIGKDIASLQDILQPPKLRGGLGEMLLERLLEQILPQANYTLQYRFQDGKIVDAVINLGQGLVPVDAKFPLESFLRTIEEEQEEGKGRSRREFVRQVKHHVDNVAAYIRPDEGTLSFALMYIPAENVYYETIIKGNEEADSDIFSYALEKRVMPVSPHSFYAYLGAIALGLKGLAIEQSAKQVVAHLQRLDGDFKELHHEFETLGTHLTHAGNKYRDTLQRMDRLGDRLASLPDSDSLSLPQSAPEEGAR